MEPYGNKAQTHKGQKGLAQDNDPKQSRGAASVVTSALQRGQGPGEGMNCSLHPGPRLLEASSEVPGPGCAG